MQKVDSESLHNYALSRGWSEPESETLKMALMKFGIGNYEEIESYLPHKRKEQVRN